MHSMVVQAIGQVLPGVMPAILKVGRVIFHNHWCILGMLMLLQYGHTFMPDSFLGCKSSPRVNACDSYLVAIVTITYSIVLIAW